MNSGTQGDKGPQNRSRRMLDVLNRHRLKLALLVAGLALLILVADSILKGSAY